MPRGDCTFRQRDVEAAVKALEKAGKRVARVRIDKAGIITVETTETLTIGNDTLLAVADEPKPERNEWDD